MSMQKRGTAQARRWRAMRPYEWRHTDPRFMEWLRVQGLSDDNWLPPAGVTTGRGRRS